SHNTSKCRGLDPLARRGSLYTAFSTFLSALWSKGRVKRLLPRPVRRLTVLFRRCMMTANNPRGGESNGKPEDHQRPIQESWPARVLERRACRRRRDCWIPNDC